VLNEENHFSKNIRPEIQMRMNNVLSKPCAVVKYGYAESIRSEKNRNPSDGVPEDSTGRHREKLNNLKNGKRVKMEKYDSRY
jgi:hypothetical protein